MANWSALCIPLRTAFAIDVTREEMALLCAGDKETLEGLVEELYTRSPTAAAPAASGAVARRRGGSPPRAGFERGGTPLVPTRPLRPAGATRPRWLSLAPPRCHAAKPEKSIWNNVSSNSVSLLMVLIIFAASMYAAIVSSLLSIFVPRTCGHGAEAHTCSNSDVLGRGRLPLSPLEQGVLSFNFVTLCARAEAGVPF